MSESGHDEGSGKKLGPFAAALAAIGMLVARAGDDCAKIGAKGAMLGDDAARGLGRAGSLADDGIRGGGKLGSLADDGMRGGAKGSLPGVHGPKPEGGGGLVEEAAGAGAKAEGHAEDVAEIGVDISMEVLSNVDPKAEDDDGHGHEDEPQIVDGVRVPPPEILSIRTTPADLLRARTIVSSPALLTVASGATKKATSEADPFAWIESHAPSNPVGFVFTSRGEIDTKKSIPLVAANGVTTDDTTIHRTCLEHTTNCVVLVCEPDAAGAKEPCVKGATAAWKTAAAMDLGSKTAVRDFLGKLLAARAGRPSLRGLVLSRLDVEATPPRIVRSRLEPQKTP
ncbi:hypothetical protein [Polyangium spumosum]|uniref:Uncharacterized protein n=1 Tax=Polyangium spumosum TaxID=889282 RepID=A0A6N7Q8G3_9BACT|nr:hypothetical protein [Polyangium spumosum]MRG97161.1 hypothetical protein [Polyangium spumosum]